MLDHAIQTRSDEARPARLRLVVLPLLIALALALTLGAAPAPGNAAAPERAAKKHFTTVLKNHKLKAQFCVANGILWLRADGRKTRKYSASGDFTITRDGQWAAYGTFSIIDGRRITESQGSAWSGPTSEMVVNLQVFRNGKRKPLATPSVTVPVDSLRAC